MRITEAGLERLSLTLVRPLRTAKATYAAREGFVVRLRDEEGRVGQGEAMPLPEFGTESGDACEQTLRAHLSQLRGREVSESLEGVTESLSATTPAARHAVEQALLDLLAQRRGLPLNQLLSRVAREHVDVNALLGEQEPGPLAEEARRALSEGFQTLKIKVGGRPIGEDAARLAAVRQAIGPELRLRADANGAWSEEEAEEALSRLGRYQLELCEQPVAAENYKALGALRPRAPCPLAADESLCLPDAVSVLLGSAPLVDILVLKPMVLGGLLPALWLARQAAAKGMDAYVTSSLDGVVARAGAAHLASALPSDRYASGLGVGHLFRDEPAEHPFRPVGGRIRVPRIPGLGLT